MQKIASFILSYSDKFMQLHLCDLLIKQLCIVIALMHITREINYLSSL